MKEMNFILMAICLFACGATISAQEENEFTVKAQIRPRYEYNHGAQYPLGDQSQATSFISNRSRLSMGYNNGFLSMGFSFQDISIWGTKPQIDNMANVSINEAWAKIASNGYFAQIGRQQLAYDDDRILGTLDWHQAGRWHDALKLGYENPNNKLHLIFAYNQVNRPQGEGTLYVGGGQPYKYMQTGYYQYDNKKNFIASLMMMNLGYQTVTNLDTTVSNMQTVGTNLSYSLNALSLGGTFYYQTGKNSTGKDVGAYMFATKAKYDFTKTFAAALGWDYLSGQKSGSSKSTWFNPLYGTHHKFYGAMDYFYASAMPNIGLSDLYASIILKPVKKLTVDLTYHNFSAQQSLEAYGLDSQGLGSEIDLTVTYPIRPYITLQGGYSVMFGTDAFFSVKGGSKDRMQHWCFLSLNINPTIFKGKFK